MAVKRAQLLNLVEYDRVWHAREVVGPQGHARNLHSHSLSVKSKGWTSEFPMWFRFREWPLARNWSKG